MKTNYLYLHSCNAKVAQLVELQPSKLVVASSSLVFRSKNLKQKFEVFYFKVVREVYPVNEEIREASSFALQSRNLIVSAFFCNLF